MGPPLPQNLTASAATTMVRAPADVPLDPAAFVIEHVEARDIFAIEAEMRRLEAVSIEPNALGGADFILAACRHFPDHANPRFIAVRQRQPGMSGTLVGLLALRKAGLDRASTVLRSWDNIFSVGGAPLIDARIAVPVLSAVLAHLARGGSGPAALCLAQINADGPFAAALGEACRALDLRLDLLSPYVRAALAIPPDGTMWSRSRRKQKRRLAEAGETLFRVAETYPDIRTALERFLALEASGWKSAAGTALLSDPAHANFVRAAVWSSARAGTVRIAELVHAGAVIASVVIFTARDCGFAWKIAHDERFGRYSPGSLLLLELTGWLTGRGDLRLIDSCATEGSALVETIWGRRLSIADAMIALRPASTRYRSALVRERLRRSLRARAKIIYNRIRRTQPAASAP